MLFEEIATKSLVAIVCKDLVVIRLPNICLQKGCRDEAHIRESSSQKVSEVSGMD